MPNEFLRNYKDTSLLQLKKKAAEGYSDALSEILMRCSFWDSKDKLKEKDKLKDKEVEKYANLLLTHDKNHALGLYVKGKMLLKKGETTEGLSFLVKAGQGKIHTNVIMKEAQAKASYDLAQYFRKKEKNTKAFVWLTQAIMAGHKESEDTFLHDQFIGRSQILPEQEKHMADKSKNFTWSLVENTFLFIVTKRCFPEKALDKWVAFWAETDRPHFLSANSLKVTEETTAAYQTIKSWATANNEYACFNFLKNYYDFNLDNRKFLEEMLKYFVSNVTKPDLKDKTLFLQVKLYAENKDLEKCLNALRCLSGTFFKMPANVEKMLQAVMPFQGDAEAHGKNITELNAFLFEKLFELGEFDTALDYLKKISNAPQREGFQETLKSCVDKTREMSVFQNAYNPYEFEIFKHRKSLLIQKQKLYPNVDNANSNQMWITEHDSIRVVLRSAVGCMQEYLHERENRRQQSVFTVLKFLPGNVLKNNDGRREKYVKSLQNLINELPTGNSEDDLRSLKDKLTAMQEKVQQGKALFPVGTFSQEMVKAFNKIDTMFSELSEKLLSDKVLAQ